ncbi:MAG TPA: lasso peptide biosynthesis B2 protein [Gemmatimonadaceae bacterium]|nr:lasso peptide biosynthesis B2 protein [Gemmatimonadaceae bacterium]
MSHSTDSAAAAPMTTEVASLAGGDGVSAAATGAPVGAGAARSTETATLLPFSSAPGSPATEAPPDPAVLSRAEALALAVGRAAEFGVFRPLCLVRAVALNRVLERHGIRGSRVRVGVRMRNGRFAAHAWVEYGDRVLGDNEAHVGSFVELSEVRLVDAR